jgi:hypothetical protein
VIRVLKQPHFSSALRRIELRRRAKNFKEHRLHQIFGFTCIAQYSQRDIHHQAMIAVEENGQRIMLPELQAKHYRFITQLGDLLVAERRRIFENAHREKKLGSSHPAIYHTRFNVQKIFKFKNSDEAWHISRFSAATEDFQRRYFPSRAIGFRSGTMASAR